jgi:hexosaminidase
VFPRAAALAELGWSGADTHDWAGFLKRLPAQLDRYRALGIQFADSAFAPVFKVTPAASGRFRVELANQVDFGTIRYTTDGSKPGSHAPAYTGPLQLPTGTTLRASTFDEHGIELAASRVQALDAATLFSHDDSALATCSNEPGFLLDGASAHGPRRVYRLELGHACWRWPNAPLNGSTHVMLTAERLAWRDGDEAKNATVYPKHSPGGEFEIHDGACTGPLLASLPFDNARNTGAQVQMEAKVVAPAGAGVRDLCIIATGDPREGVWAVARVAFTK